MLDPKVAELLNTQVNKEFYSAYLYLDFANYYKDQGLDGFANCIISRHRKNATMPCFSFNIYRITGRR